MTVVATNAVDGPYLGTGAQVVFSFTFEAAQESEVVVVLTTDTGEAVTDVVLVNPTNYVVDLGAKTVTLGAAPTADPLQTLTVYRSQDKKQGASFTYSGAFLPKVHEDALDKLTKTVQEHEARLNRISQLPLSRPALASTKVTYVYIDRKDVTSGAEIDFFFEWERWEEIRFVLNAFHPNADGIALSFQLSADGATFPANWGTLLKADVLSLQTHTGGSINYYSKNDVVNDVPLLGVGSGTEIAQNSADPANGELVFRHVQRRSVLFGNAPSFDYDLNYPNSTSGRTRVLGHGTVYRTSAVPILGIRFLVTGGIYNVGRVVAYGIPK